jgi:hypothetical protein
MRKAAGAPEFHPLPQQLICFQVVGGAPRDLEYKGIGCGSFMSRLNASKNDHVTNLSSGRRGGSGFSTVMSA